MPRLPAVFKIAVVLLAAACSKSPDAAAAVIPAPLEQASPAAATTLPAVPQSHPVVETAAAPAPAMDPIPPQAAALPTAVSILTSGRARKPLVRSASAPQGPAIIPLGSEIPDGPVAAADAPHLACAEPRPTACNLDYKPVCADVDTGVRCIKAPCPSGERKNFASPCKACRDIRVGAYVSGTCPKD